MRYLRSRGDVPLTSVTLDGGLIAVSRLANQKPGHGISDDHAPEDAFLASFQLRDYHGDLWLDGKKLDFSGSRQGNFTLYDYNRNWRANLRSSFDCVNFHIPRTAMASLEEDLGTRRLEILNVPPGTDIDDPVVRCLVNATLPLFDMPQHASRLLIDQIGTALAIHIGHTYGGLRPDAGVPRSGLAPWQTKRAMAFIDANLGSAVGLAAVAGECGLSVSHFSRGFKISTGISPHKWLAGRRIQVATGLLKNSSLSLQDIAMKCGFADQSHFTRSFTKAKGISPGAWRNGEHFSSSRYENDA